jgi:hypothetical protein
VAFCLWRPKTISRSAGKERPETRFACDRGRFACKRFERNWDTVSEEDRLGAAFHEAGHAVVAWALGLSVREIEIGVNGDDAAGRAEIEDSVHLPIVDQIAVCLAHSTSSSVLLTSWRGLATMAKLSK